MLKSVLTYYPSFPHEDPRLEQVYLQSPCISVQQELDSRKTLLQKRLNLLHLLPLPDFRFETQLAYYQSYRFPTDSPRPWQHPQPKFEKTLRNLWYIFKSVYLNILNSILLLLLLGHTRNTGRVLDERISDGYNVSGTIHVYICHTVNDIKPIHNFLQIHMRYSVVFISMRAGNAHRWWWDSGL